MEGIWLASYVALWILVVFLVALVFILYHQLGVMYLGRVDSIMRDGLSVGSQAPDFVATDQQGRSRRLTDFLRRPTVLVFGAENCTLCEKVVPELNRFARERSGELDVLFLVQSQEAGARALAERYGTRVPLWTTASDDALKRYRVQATPFGYLIDEQGIVRAKGLVNNEEHLRFLVEAPDSTNHHRVELHAQQEEGHHVRN